MQRKLLPVSLSFTLLMTSCFGPGKSGLTFDSRGEKKASETKNTDEIVVEEQGTPSVTEEVLVPKTIAEAGKEAVQTIKRAEKSGPQELLKTDLGQTCDLMQNIELEKKRALLLEKYGDQVLYSAFNHRKRKIVTYKTKDMVKNYFHTLRFKAEEYSISFKERLAYEAIKNTLEKQYKFLSLIKNDDLLDEYAGLNSCLKGSKRLKSLVIEKDDLPTRKSAVLLESEIANAHRLALKTRLILTKIETYENELKEKLQAHWIESTKNKRGNISNPQKEYREALRKEYAEKIGALEIPLKLIAKDHPLLLTTKNDIKLKKWNNVKLDESDYTKTLLEGFNPQIVKELLKLIESKPIDIAMKEYFLGYKDMDYMANHLEGLLKSNKVQSVLNESIMDFVEATNNGMETLCEEKGAELHHSKSLVEEVLNENANQDSLYSSLMAADHGAYCYLLENEPKKDLREFGFATKAGMGTLVAGALTWLLVGSGVGIPIVAIGGAILMVDTGINTYTSTAREDVLQTLSFGGWIEHREYLEQIGVTYDLYTEIGTDVALTLGTAGSGHLLKGASKTAARANGVENIDLSIALDADKRSKEALKVLNAKAYKKSSYYGKYKRGYVNQSLIENGSAKSIEKYKELLWIRHEEMAEAYKQSEKTYNTYALREWFRIRNKNDIPTYHMYGKSGEETFGILDTVENAAMLKTDQGKEALDIIANKWFKNTENYRDEINKAIEAGIPAKTRVKEGEKALDSFKISDFKNGQSKTVSFTHYEDGAFVQKDITFQTYYDLKMYVKKQEQLSSSTFARNSLEELTHSSDLYKIMDAQAIDWRKLEFLRDTLKSVPNPNKTQQGLLEKTEKLLARKDLKPRADAMHRLEVLELKEEMKKWSLAMTKGGGFLKNAKFKLSDKAVDTVKNSPVLGRWIMGFGAIGTVTATKSFTNRYVESGGSWDEFKSNSVLKRNKIERRFNNGLTLAESDCAKQPRWFNFHLCVHESIKTAIGIERARAIVTDKNYRFENDSAVISKAYEVAYRIIKERKRQRSAEIFQMAQKVLGSALGEMTKNEVVALIQKVSGSQIIAHHAARIFAAETEAEAFNYLQESEGLLGADFSYALKWALENKSEVESSVKDSGRLPQTLENLILGLTLEEADIKLEEEDFFEFTVDMLEQAQEDLTEMTEN